MEWKLNGMVLNGMVLWRQAGSSDDVLYDVMVCSNEPTAYIGLVSWKLKKVRRIRDTVTLLSV